MLPAQRIFLRQRLASFALSLLLIVGLLPQITWWLLLPLAAWAKATADTRSAAEEASRANLTEMVAAYPLLKIWWGLCAVAAFCGAIYVTRSGITVFDSLGAIALPFVVLIAPLVWVLERKRFLALGAHDVAAAYHDTTTVSHTTSRKPSITIPSLHRSTP